MQTRVTVSFYMTVTQELLTIFFFFKEIDPFHFLSQDFSMFTSKPFTKFYQVLNEMLISTWKIKQPNSKIVINFV